MTNVKTLFFRWSNTMQWPLL